MSILVASTQPIGTRRRVFGVILLAVISIFALRLVQLQVIEGGKYRLQADAQGIKKMTIQPVRGAMYDRNGYVVVGSDGSHSLYVTPNKFDARSRALVSAIVGIDTAEIVKLTTKYRINEYTPTRILRDIDDTTWAKLNEFYYEIDGVDLENDRTQ